MTAADNDLSDWERFAFVTALCIFLLVLDMAAPDAGTAQLYVLAAATLYGVRTKRVVATCWAVAVLLIIAGTWLGRRPDWEFASSRAVLIAIVTAVTIAVWRLSTRESVLRDQALLDPLTGVFNRRCFLEVSAREESRNQRGDGHLAVLMIDVDHFKQVNDTHGHAIGDVVLKGVAEVCAATLRPSDVIARYGGEEFVVSLPDTDQTEAAAVAERVRAAIEARVFTSPNGPISVTASIGVARCSKEVPLGDALRLADESLYRAKRLGRNRVEVAPVVAPTRPFILVVDDDDDFRSLMTRWLGDHGYAVAEAENAHGALRLLEANPSIDLLLTDIVMPGGLAGFELGQRAEQIRPGIKLLYMSGYAAAQTFRADQGPTHPMMQKPFRLTHLVETVETVLQH